VKARKKELAARTDPPGKVYEITLKNAEQPGLPAPVGKTNSVAAADAKTAPKEGTNTTVQVAVNGEESPEETLADEKVSNVDIALEEARRILVDLLTLTRGNSLAGTGLN
jgi:hypothetical protein